MSVLLWNLCSTVAQMKTLTIGTIKKDLVQVMSLRYKM